MWRNIGFSDILRDRSRSKIVNILYFSGILYVWIGLKDKRWVTGEIFENVFGINTQLNDYDHKFTSETEHCGRINISDIIPLRDDSCNRRQWTGFACEIVLL